MARVLSIVIAIVASVLVFAASVLAVAALLFLRSSGDGSSAVSPTGAIPDRTASLGGPPGSTADAGLNGGPGAFCRAVSGRGFDVVASGAGPGDQVTVAVDLIDDRGDHHAQLVPAGAADDQGMITASLPATVNGREVVACAVTAVQLGDRVVYAGR